MSGLKWLRAGHRLLLVSEFTEFRIVEPGGGKFHIAGATKQGREVSLFECDNEKAAQKMLRKLEDDLND